MRTLAKSPRLGLCGQGPQNGKQARSSEGNESLGCNPSNVAIFVIQGLDQRWRCGRIRDGR
jgi:hypothetical protein